MAKKLLIGVAMLSLVAGCCQNDTGCCEKEPKCEELAPTPENSPLLANPNAKKMNFISIVRWTPGDIDGMIAEAKRAAVATGVKKNAYSMSILPTGSDPIKVVEKYATAFGKFRQGLEGTDIEPGILVQSLVGHGWAGAPKVETDMEFAYNQLGKTVYRQCMMDKNFRKYVWDSMVLLAKQKPAFFLMDDDTRLINNSTNGVECFCDSHMKYYNEIMPRKFADRMELIHYLEKAPADDPVVKIFESERRKLLLGFAQLIRDAIDSVDPSIPCGYCAGGGEYLLMGDIARTLAGKNESFMRINDANYLEQQTRDFNISMYQCAFKSRAAGNVDYILDESDTCPHSRYSKSAISMHSHIAGSILYGTSGGKLWITDLLNGTLVSTGAYENIIKENLPFYNALRAEMDNVEWIGAVTPLVDVRKNFNPARARGGFYLWRDWQRVLFNIYGIPGRYEYIKNDGSIYLLTEEVVNCLDDKDLKTILSNKAIVDGYGAKALAKRGFAEYLGCKPVDKEYRTSGEFFNFKAPAKRTRFQNNFTLPYLDELAPGVEVLSECKMADKTTGELKTVAPATILYRNPAGGVVVTRAVSVGHNPYNDYGPAVKDMLLEILNRLDENAVPFCAGEEQPIHFRCGKLKNGGYLLALVNLGFDELKNVDLRTKLPVKTVEFLDVDGVYKALDFTKNDTGIVVDKRVPCYDTLILRVR